EPALVALREEGEEDLDLVGRLLHVADVVEDDEVEHVQAPEGAWQLEIALGGKQILHELVGRGEQHGVPGLDQGVSDGAGRVALADTGQTERTHISETLRSSTTSGLSQAGRRFDDPMPRKKPEAVRPEWVGWCRRRCPRRFVSWRCGMRGAGGVDAAGGGGGAGGRGACAGG